MKKTKACVLLLLALLSHIPVAVAPYTYPPVSQSDCNSSCFSHFLSGIPNVCSPCTCPGGWTLFSSTNCYDCNECTGFGDGNDCPSGTFIFIIFIK